jgi:hypothetical protein
LVTNSGNDHGRKSGASTNSIGDGIGCGGNDSGSGGDIGQRHLYQANSAPLIDSRSVAATSCKGVAMAAVSAEAAAAGVVKSAGEYQQKPPPPPRLKEPKERISEKAL